MTTGRTVDKWTRVYIDGYDQSGFSRTIGPLEMIYDAHDLTADMSDIIKGYLRGSLQVNAGTLSGVFDNTATTGAHALRSAGASGIVNLMAAIGIQAAPDAGDACFCGQFLQTTYNVEAGGAVLSSAKFDGVGVTATSLLTAGWGLLLHPNTAVTAANTATGHAHGDAVQTTTGGLLFYQVLAGNGTATISVDDSANNSTWAALSGATTGSIDCSAISAGVIALGATATVRAYLRWQIALGTASSVTFVSAFIRR